MILKFLSGAALGVTTIVEAFRVQTHNILPKMWSGWRRGVAEHSLNLHQERADLILIFGIASDALHLHATERDSHFSSFWRCAPVKHLQLPEEMRQSQWPSTERFDSC